MNVIVKDCSLCKESTLYPYFLFFLEKGIHGDKTAFALASDVFRMAILALTPATDYFIYVDPNDVTLVDLKHSLRNLSEYMLTNSLGFSFYVSPLFGRSDLFHVRNDVLIALKEKNPDFFRDYLNAYRAHLEKTYREYFNPVTDGDAQRLAGKITVQTSDVFFQIRVSSGNVCATFGSYQEIWPVVHAEMPLAHERKVENGNTWLPLNNLCEERALLENLNKKHALELVSTTRRIKSAAISDDELLNHTVAFTGLFGRGSRSTYLDMDGSPAGHLSFPSMVSFDRLNDHFPDYPLAKSGDKKVAVQDPTKSTTFYLRLYSTVLLKVENYGTTAANYETFYYDQRFYKINMREQDPIYETTLFKKAIRELLEEQTCSVAVEPHRLSTDGSKHSSRTDYGLYPSLLKVLELFSKNDYNYRHYEISSAQ